MCNSCLINTYLVLCISSLRGNCVVEISELAEYNFMRRKIIVLDLAVQGCSFFIKKFTVIPIISACIPHTQTHTHTYIYIYINSFNSICLNNKIRKPMIAIQLTIMYSKSEICRQILDANCDK